MFRLIKLALYALVGYALYELYQGMVQGEGMQQSRMGGQRGGGQQGERFGANAVQVAQARERGQPRPATPTASGLTSPNFDPPGNLATGMVYHWDVQARNNAGTTPGLTGATTS